MAGVKSDLSRRLNRYRGTPGSDLLEQMSGIEDLAAKMRTADLGLDNYMLYTIFIAGLIAECEVEARNLASHDSIGREEVITAVRE